MERAHDNKTVGAQGEELAAGFLQRAGFRIVERNFRCKGGEADIVARDGNSRFDRADPYAFAAEVPPRTASKVADLSRYGWHDADWMARRRQTNWLECPLSFYEVHLGSWRRPGDDPSRWLSYRDLAHQLAEYCREMGYTHIELLPIMEYPYSGLRLNVSSALIPVASRSLSSSE